MTQAGSQRSVFIAAISSDIGRELARRYLAQGFDVAGSYRPSADVSAILSLGAVSLFPCDVGDVASIREAVARYAEHVGPEGWNTFVSAVGDLRPIGPITSLDMAAWGASVHVNGVGQLQLLQALLGAARAGTKQVCFLIGGGMNGPFPNYSAYCLGKLALVKACELLDDERPDIHAIAVGTGWVATRIHEQTLAAGASAGINLERTRAFLERGEVGTSHDDIFGCISWCFAQGRAATGGRNFSVVHDGWREGDALAATLAADPSRFKLRRAGNG